MTFIFGKASLALCEVEDVVGAAAAVAEVKPDDELDGDDFEVGLRSSSSLFRLFNFLMASFLRLESMVKAVYVTLRMNMKAPTIVNHFRIFSNIVATKF